MFFADSQAFFDLQALPPDTEARPAIDPNIKLDLALVTSVPPFVKETEQALTVHRRFKRHVESQQKFLTCRHTDIVGRVKVPLVVFGAQHAPDDCLGQVQKLKDAGILVSGICYSGHNRFGSGYLDHVGGLTMDGERLVVEMAETGICLDLSHCGHQTAEDALSLFTLSNGQKVMASHGGVHETYSHPRNLPVSTLKRVADHGGYVGLCLVPFMLHRGLPEGTFSTAGYDLSVFVLHLRRAIQACGEDQVGIGSDIYYRHVPDDAAQGQFERMSAMLNNDKLKARLPLQPEKLNRPDWMVVMAEYLSNFYPGRVVEKILGGNLLGFWMN